MHVAIATVPRPRSSLGVVATLCGVAGAGTAVVLWLYQQRPGSSLLGRYGYEIAHGGPLREDLILLAALLGSVAVAGAILSSIGGAAKPTAVAAILLGAVALTFPVMTWLEVIDAPISLTLFPGT